MEGCAHTGTQLRLHTLTHGLPRCTGRLTCRHRQSDTWARAGVRMGTHRNTPGQAGHSTLTPTHKHSVLEARCLTPADTHSHASSHPHMLTHTLLGLFLMTCTRRMPYVTPSPHADAHMHTVAHRCVHTQQGHRCSHSLVHTPQSGPF